MANNNYTLGRGKVNLARFKDGTQEPDGFRYIGNTPEFNLSIELEELDHFSSDEGIREKDDSVPLEVNRTGSMITDNVSPENVALFFFGSYDKVTQAAVPFRHRNDHRREAGAQLPFGRRPEQPDRLLRHRHCRFRRNGRCDTTRGR